MSMLRGFRKWENSSIYISAVLFLFLDVKTVMFFLYIVEHYSIIKPVFLISLKAIIRKSAKYVATNTVRLVKLIMWFIILFAIVAAVCVITVIVTVLRKKSK